MTTATLSAVDQLKRLVQWVGDGRPLTANGNLRLADARYLVENLNTGDHEFAGIADHHRRVRSSADLWHLQDLLAWAKIARLLRAEHQRLLPVKKNVHLAADAQLLRDALLKSLQASCQAYVGRYSWLSYVYEDADLAHETLWQHLPGGAEESARVADVVDAVWDALTEHDDEPLVGRQLEDCRRLVHRDVTYLLARYADLGVLDLCGGESQVKLTEFGAAWAADQFSPHMLELNIGLDAVKDPRVWRRLQVPDYWTLGLLGRAVEDAMGWEEGRGHYFTVGRLSYGDRSLWDVERDEHSVTLARALEPGQRFRFVYDPDDAQWRHTIIVERRFPEPDLAAHARCTDGAGRCPVEDCTGPAEFAQLKVLLAETGPHRAERIRHLLGYDFEDGFDPADFSVDEANQRLQGDHRRG